VPLAFSTRATGGGRLAASLLTLAAALAATAAPAAEPSHQALAPPASAWTAPATVALATEDVSFRASDSVTFRGTLLVPRGSPKAPLVVVFHGASSPSRNEALYDHLKQMLPSLGIAVFVYDRRGTGASGGKASGNAYDRLADDGIAAAQTLARDPRIDPARIGFWGLSQGGWLSLLAASRWKQTAFAISVSAPMVTPDVQMNFAVANILRIKGYSEADIRLALSARTAVDEFERGQLDRAAAQKRLDAVVDKPWFPLIYMDKTFADPDKSGWAKEIRHDPLASIGSINARTLILYGARDPWVPVAVSVDRLRTFTVSHPNMIAAVVGGADHAMMMSVPPARQIDPAFFPVQAPDSPEYFGRLAAWLQVNGIARSPARADEQRSR